MNTSYKQGIIFALLSAVMVSTSGMFTKLAGNSLSVDQILFFRFIISSIYILFFVRNFKTLLKTTHVPLLVIRSILGALTLFFLYTSFYYSSLSNVTALYFMTPFYIPIILRLTWKKTPVVPKLYYGMVVAFLGVILIIKPGINAFQPSLLLPIIGGMLAAFVFVSIRKAHHDRVPIITILAYYFFIALIFTGIYWLISGAPIPHTPLAWLYLFLIGITITLYQHFLTLATKFMPVRLVSPLQYFSVIIAGFYDFFIWQKAPGIISLIGLTLVVIGVIYVVLVLPRIEST